tara:strand:- start:5542 stop:6933 length:1392 start_codon:yes stop_codon:yes gene_type:complete
LERKNILFLFTDDQRFDTISAHGNLEIKTPNLDLLASNGTSFKNAYIMGGTDFAVCMPSRAMLMTGRTLFHLQDAGQTIPNHHVMLGETLQANGFHSWGAGKWHNGSDSYARNFNDGSDVYFGGMYDHWMVPVHRFDPGGEYAGRITRTAAYRPSNVIEEKIADHMHSGTHSTELFAGQFCEFIDNYESEDPFFAYIAFMAPHDPRTMPQEFLDLYDADDLTLDPNFMEAHPFDNGQLTVRDELLSSIPRQKRDTMQHIAEYYAMISHVDHQIGLIVNALEKSGKLEDTIIVFAGDNGLALGRHGLFGKQSLYDHSIHIPMIISGPGVPRGMENEALVYTADLYPTLCDLVGVEIPETVVGSSLAPTIAGTSDGPRDYMYFAYKDLMRSVYFKDYKLIEYNVYGKRNTQLFNMKCDPSETINLANKDEFQTILSRLRQKMLEGKKEYADNLPPFDTFWNGVEF